MNSFCSDPKYAPVPGLFLSGQDVMTPGIAVVLAGGLFGAAAIYPLIQKLK